MAGTIQLLVLRMIAAQGALYRIQWKALQFHLQGLSNEGFEAEVNQIDNPDVFGYLWSSGLSATRQAIVARRAKEVD